MNHHKEKCKVCGKEHSWFADYCSEECRLKLEARTLAKKIPEEVIQDWVKNKKRIQDRLNRLKKRLKKYEKQKNHFEMRLKAIHAYEKTKKDQA
jgi:predicted ribosome quality control (RQC) complex YloA/Tae2 family protein